MRLFAILCASLALSACSLFSGSPQAQWDRQQAFYNVAAEAAIELREPCVLIGPDDPGCVLDDEKYAKTRVLLSTADGYLKAADVQIQAGEESKARFYIKSAAGALIAIADQVNMQAPEMEE